VPWRPPARHGTRAACQTGLTMARDPVLPTLRAAVFTAVCLGLGAGAHRMMSESAIPASAMVFAGVGVYALARLGTRRERSLVGIAALMGGLQIALHLLFDYAQHPSHVSGTRAASGTAGVTGATSAGSPAGGSLSGMVMSGGGGAAAGGGSGGGTLQGLGGGCLLPPVHTAMIGMSGAGMLLAHVLAAVLCACWLYQGEAAVHALARSAGTWVLYFVLAPLAHLVPAGIGDRHNPRVEADRPTPRSQWLRGSRPLRGPPRVVSFG
jgi:hypothetical protein